MRNSKKYGYLITLGLLVMLVSCQTTSKTSLRNLAALYEPEKQYAGLECRVFHTSDSVSVLFVKVNYGKLAYQKDPFTGLYACSYRLSYKLFSGYEAGEVLRFSSLMSGDSLNYGRNASATHSMEVTVVSPGKYLLEVSLTDLNRQAEELTFLKIDKTSRHNGQNFLVTDREGKLIFSDNLSGDESFRILTAQPLSGMLHVSYYNRDFPVARPPYVEEREPVFNYRPDSSFFVGMHNGESEWLTMPGPGFCHFRLDTTQRQGLTLFQFPGGFPDVTTAGQLMSPLRYITTRKEYDSITASTNPKAAVDDFWLKTARSPERALSLLQKYYSNVEEANRFFTSYVEGWKSDRGLIYIVLGRPGYVYRSDDAEEWIYGEPQNRNSLRFTFVRMNNPFTDNDYLLLRSPTFKDPWFITVQSWRR